ncbi:MAG TPA: RNase adapter RapZ [Candidatus Acutalibacter stercorigallinarum]|nr:RNase adapter RapZ [Candidatus Acutalibacter stercorigallinarum]
MEFVVVTGLSGAGKTQAMHAMEDIGFFCVDNLPPALIPVFYDLCVKSEDIMGRVAVVTDTRGGELFKSFFTAMEALKHDKKPYKILFLDASDNVLVRRFKETRRKHPLSDDLNGSLEQAVKLEREMLKPMRESSDYVIDTSLVSPAQLRSRIAQLFLNSAEDSLAVHCISFGFKYGVPMESDLVFDVRCLPNPFYDENLRPLTGLDAPVRDYVMEKEETKGFVARFTDMVDYLLPLYAKEGKSQLVIAVGCTGGHHRSVALAQYMHDHLVQKGVRASVTHRDMQKH